MSILNQIVDTFTDSKAHWKPIYELKVDGVLLNPLIKDRLMSLTLRDERGLVSDELELTLSDHDGAIALPRRGAEIAVKLGWEHLGLVDKGVFKVQGIRHSGAPDVMTITARSIDLGGDWTVKKERSFHGKKLGEILKTIADEHKLSLKVTPSLANHAIEHLDQQKESDISLINTLAEEYDALATIKNNVLIFVTKGAAATAGGTEIPLVTITRKLGDKHDFSIDDTEQYTGVTAHWHDTHSAKRKSITARRRKSKSNKSSLKKGEVIEGSKENTKVLRHTYATKQSAARAAANEWKKLQRACADFQFTLANADPSLIPEAPAQILGIKDFIEDRKWLIKQLTHSLTDSSFTTQMELESILLGEFDLIDSES